MMRANIESITKTFIFECIVRCMTARLGDRHKRHGFVYKALEFRVKGRCSKQGFATFQLIR